MVEDWLNPEPEVGGEFAPQVQHYLAGQAGPPDCVCRPPAGLPAQQKISKVKYFPTAGQDWNILLLRLLTSSTCVVEAPPGPAPGPRLDPPPPQLPLEGRQPVRLLQHNLPPAEPARGSPETPTTRQTWWDNWELFVSIMNYVHCRLSRRAPRQHDARDPKLQTPTRGKYSGVNWRKFY